MTAKTGSYSPVRVTLLLMALLLAITPMTFAAAELADASATEAPTEAVAQETSEPAEEPAPAAETEVTEATAAPETEAAQTEAAQAETTEAAPTAAKAAPSASGSANDSGPYDSTSDGSPSGNGNGGGNGNQPCAGCVGNADDKNPPGQLPGPDEDGNKGYECDDNSGVGKTNPAHSGCQEDEPDPDPLIGLEKTGPTRAEIGDTITYSFDVTNTGDTVLTNVHITDPLIGGGQIAVSPTTLAVGATGEATAQYTVDADDVTPANEVPNTATVHGTDPDGTVVTDQDSWVVEVPPIIVIPKMHTICHATGQPTKFVVLTANVNGVFSGHYGPHHHDARDIIPPFQYDEDGDGGLETLSQNWDAAGQAIFDAGCEVPDNPAIDLEKSGPESTAIGEVITYNFVVTNTGDVPLTDVHVTDPLLGGAEIAVTPGTLAPGAEGVATAEYTVAAADVTEDDTIPNTATAHGTPPAGGEVTAVDDHIVAVPDDVEEGAPAIALDKGGPSESDIGEVITYTFDVTNTGETTLLDVHVTDPLLGGTPIAVTPSTLEVGEEGTATAQYTVAAADVEQRSIDPAAAPTRFVPNTATAHGTSPMGSGVTATDDHEVLLPAEEEEDPPAINLEKDGPLTSQVGERITYTFRVTNTGGQTLTNVHIDDPMLSSRSLAVTPSTLAPDGVGTARATYRVTKTDGEAGQILNTAVTRGTPPFGPDVEDSDDHTVLVPPPGPLPGIRLEKVGPATAQVGDVITYRFRATNTGQTTLTNVHITDEKLGIDNLAVTPSTLTPGQSGTASATYTVTETDGEAGFVFNTAVVTGDPPSGPPITDRDDHTTDIPGGPDNPPDEDLPATGTDVPTQVMLAALALLLGAGLLLAARRTTPVFDSWSTGIAGPRPAGAASPPPVHRRPGAGPRLAG